MSLHPQPSLPPVPEETARVAHAVFRRGNPCLLLRERLGAVFDDADFADLYPRRGQPAYAPWRLALVTLLQFREGLSDRQAAEAVRARIGWKYLLSLDLDDAGFGVPRRNGHRFTLSRQNRNNFLSWRVRGWFG
jgi:transposase